MQILPTKAELQAEFARRHLKRFVLQAWPIIEPTTPYRDNWHVDAICEHLEALGRKQIRKLIITMPPGMMKSTLCSVMFPAWMWTWNPGWQSLWGSYGYDLAKRDSSKCRKLVESEWFQRYFAQAKGWKMSKSGEEEFHNSLMGFRMTISPDGKTTGFRGNFVGLDDPLNALDARSEPERTKVIEYLDKSLPSRVNDPAVDGFLVVMQRLHEGDPVGHLLRQGGWEHLNLPMEFEAKRRSKTSIGWTDPRQKEGELLFPSYFTPAVLTEFKKRLGSDGYAGQYQQRPVSGEGGLLKRTWMLNRWHKRGQAPLEGMAARLLPESFDRWCIAVDSTFKDSAKSDRVAMWVLASKKEDVYCLDLKWGRMGIVETMATLKDLAAKWPRARPILIEDKANGEAIIEIFKKAGVGAVVPVSPGKDSKESRIAAMAPYFEAGNVWLPQDAPWVGDFIEEAVSFPKGLHDDAVDALAYGVMRLVGSSGAQKFRELANGDNLRPIRR